MATKILVQEVDDAGQVTKSFVTSGGGQGDGVAERVDVVHAEKNKSTASIAKHVLDAFLPVGFPDTVTEDYLNYQIYVRQIYLPRQLEKLPHIDKCCKDSLQAFSSSIAGLLSSRAVLSSVGVGDADARPQDALVLSIVQESLGRVATILFAHRFGTAIEPECKRYRLLADVFNDAAMVLDCLSPALPGPARVGALAGSSVLRALTGVCAGSAKGCLSAHFAKAGNLGELNAKDSSQETVISLAGMLFGTVVISYITSFEATWAALVLLLSVHLAMNRAAVRAVCLRSINRQRCCILFSALLESGTVFTPQQVTMRETIFERGSVLRWSDGRKIGHCRFGTVQDLLASLSRERASSSGSHRNLNVALSRLIRLFDEQRYILWFDRRDKTTTIVLKQDAGPVDQLKAWVQALILSRDAQDTEAGTDQLGAIERTCRSVDLLFEAQASTLRLTGWDLSVCALETQAVARITCPRG